MLTENEKREKADSALGRMMWLVILWGLVGLPLRLVSAIVSRVFVVMYPWDVDYWFWKNVVSPYAENHYPAKHPVRENAKLQYPGRVVLAHELYYQPTTTESGKYTHPDEIMDDMSKRIIDLTKDLRDAIKHIDGQSVNLNDAGKHIESLQERLSVLTTWMRLHDCPTPDDAAADEIIKTSEGRVADDAIPLGPIGAL